MPNLRDLINYAATGNVMAFRKEFSSSMNDKMAQSIQFKDNTPPPSTPVNEAVEEGDEEESKKKENSDIFLFNSQVAIQKAKDIVSEYNKSHENTKLEIRMFKSSEGSKMYTIGDKVSRIYVRSLIRSIGGKYEK